jgi:ribonuclease BN (tRNA processing enzyme)
MLGTGGAFAKQYYNTNALIYVGDNTLLIDCGITALLSLHQLGKTVAHIDAVVISHMHADHIGGIEELAYQLKFIYDRRIPLFIPASLIAMLWEKSLSGGLETTESPSLAHYFDVRPLYEGTPTEIFPNMTLTPIRTKHIPGKESFSFILNENIFYSSDMTFDAHLLRGLVDNGCELLLHECQFESPGVVHTTLDELLTLPPSIQRRLWLMHYGDSRAAYEGKTGLMRFLDQHARYSLTMLKSKPEAQM